MTAAGPSLPVIHNADDFVVLARLVRQDRMRLYRRIAIGMIALAILLLVLDAMMNQPAPWWQDGFALAAAAALWALASPAIQGRLTALGDRGAKLSASQSFTVSDQGFEARSADGHSVLKWSAIPQVLVEDGRLFVFVSPASAYIVPRRSFVSETEFDRFVDAAKLEWKKVHRL